MKTSRSQGSSDDGNATLRLHFLKPFTKEEVESFKFFSWIHGCLAKAMVPLPPCPGMCQTKCTENIVCRWQRRWSVPSCRSCSSSCTPSSQLRLSSSSTPSSSSSLPSSSSLIFLANDSNLRSPPWTPPSCHQGLESLELRLHLNLRSPCLLFGSFWKFLWTLHSVYVCHSIQMF